MNDTRQPRRAALTIYADRRMPRILLLGFISGFPWVLIGAALSLWLKEEGLSRSTIGWAGLIFSVYAVNFLWAPLIDRVRIPWLTERVGHRKAWIMALQGVILLCMLFWSTLDPATSLAWVIAGGLLIAICSASQDITIDALRIEQIEAGNDALMAAGAAMAVVGWWTGFKVGGMIALFSADALEKAGYANYWQLTFVVLGLLVIACNVALQFIPEVSAASREREQQALQARIAARLTHPSPAAAAADSDVDEAADRRVARSRLTRIAAWLTATVVGPFQSFFRSNGVRVALALIGFILLFKVGEAFVGRMSIVFYEEIGFSKTDIALYSKGLGWITTVAFTLLGGWFTIRSGIVKALFYSGIAMAGTNLMFSLLAWAGTVKWLFAVTVLVDDIAAAFATVAFVTFISLLVDRTYTATQYALLASLGNAGRTVLAASSGALVDWLDGDWAVFFMLTTLMVVPSLCLLWFIRREVSAATSRGGQPSASQAEAGVS